MGLNGFSKVLIANRGEIAVRIARTLRSLGIASVAVYSDADRESLHLEACDEAVRLGEAPAIESYLDIERVIEACRSTGAQAVHPGYGFLSENAEFARRLEESGIVFIGPSLENLDVFGLKHKARAAALAAGVPLLPGSGLLGSLEEAVTWARKIEGPVILKSTGGGGGIGMKICRSENELRQAYESVKALASRNFKDSGVYLERYVEYARHIEVQVFGDGQGNVVVLGDRDCSAQRRNQKVIEEAPAPGLSHEVRTRLHEAAAMLARREKYRSAGTLEFVFDTQTQEFFFLEVNTRLQVEHTVTEEIYSIDLVEWMIRLAAGSWSIPDQNSLRSQGCSIQARLYAEDAWRNFIPTPATVTGVRWPAQTRVETWVRSGAHVSAHYDPMIAKLIVRAETREKARTQLIGSLKSTRVGGITTNREYLIGILESPTFCEAGLTTRFLAEFRCDERTVEVLKPGTQSTIQDWPGRRGYWQVGIPPSGPMDSLSHRVANRIVGNDERAPALEMTVVGVTLKFRCSTRFALFGAVAESTLTKSDGRSLPVEYARAAQVESGDVLTIGAFQDAGQRAYLAIEGGFDVEAYLGSASTFTLGGFGGHSGRALAVYDVLPIGTQNSQPRPNVALDPAEVFERTGRTTLRVLCGPQGAPEFFRAQDLVRLANSRWTVHFNSSRTGIRLIGPTPDWPRTDGGEAGLHPSNLHDNAYAVGAMDFTGDMPVLLGPDGPSLGGFVCPLTVIHADLWKLGQLKSPDEIRFVIVDLDEAYRAELEVETFLQNLDLRVLTPIVERSAVLVDPVLARIETEAELSIVVRQSGDRNLLIEFGENELDLRLRIAVAWFQKRLEDRAFPGIVDLTPGIRSLQVHFEPSRTSQRELVSWIERTRVSLSDLESFEIPNRTVWLPLSWDDPSTRLAIEKYTTGVRANAPWCPWNIEFIRRINGLADWKDVYDIVFQASYLVMGLGDVYLGAPVATPLDPRHRLVTTKYNPARTWTPENAVGIGGAYLCVYGMEGPGGYQFVGRTIQMWNKFFQTAEFEKPWLLRFFDQIRFYSVSADELTRLRQDFPLGRAPLKIERGTFRVKDYLEFLASIESETASFRAVQKTAFEAERARWKSEGLDTFQLDAAPAVNEVQLPSGTQGTYSPLAGILWQRLSQSGDVVEKGQVLAVMESMKMEIQIESPCSGTVVETYKAPGESIVPGEPLFAIKEVI